MVAITAIYYERRLNMKAIGVSELTCFRGLDSVIVNAVMQLENLGYRRRTIENYRYTWKEFSQFAMEHSEMKTFSTDLVCQFLENHGIATDKVETGLTFRQCHIRNVMHALTGFALHGCLQRRSYVTGRTKFSTQNQEALSDYEQFCRNHMRSSFGTIRSHKRDIIRFLHYLESRGVNTVKELQASTVSQFVLSCSPLRPTTLARLISSIRSFMRFLCMEGITSSILVEQLPRIRVRPDEHIPSVWKNEDVVTLLASVDRSSPCGKRDYAILLLAARLGMRVSDIRNLRFENLLWEKARIEINQAKGGRPLAWPLTEDIGHALIDYLRHGRPASKHRHVFLRANAPFEPFGRDNNLYYIITRYRRRAAITLPVKNRKGMHSLRHTVASQLLEAGIPLETISGIMGHLSVETTRIYTKINVGALQSAAIDPEEVTYE
jgi:site-specific recombinase XerD